jgi:hypothetical protein
MSNTPSKFRRKARTESMTFPVDPNDAAKIMPIQQAHQSAIEALSMLTDGDASADAIAGAQAKVDQTKAAYDEALADYPTVTFHLRAMSGVQLQAIQSDNPPKPEQIEMVKKSDPDAAAPDFDPETYPPALLAAACTGVEWSDGTKAKSLSEADAVEFYESSSFGDQQQMMTVITLLNQLPSRVNALGKD